MHIIKRGENTKEKKKVFKVFVELVIVILIFQQFY